MINFTGLTLKARDEIETFAAGLLSSEIEKRCNSKPKIGESESFPCISLETDSTISDNDSFEITENELSLTIKARGIRGLIFGIGLFLRKTIFKNGQIILTESINGIHKPYMKIRGHQLGYRDTPNTYDAWSIDDYYNYIKELMYFGCNTFEHTIFNDKPENRNRLMKYSETDFLRECTKAVSSLDIDVSLWYPNDEESLRDSIKKRKKVFADIPRIDFYFPPGGDPGDYDADEFILRTKAISDELKKTHPEALVFPSAQAPHGKDNWGSVFVKEMEKQPKEIDGIITGPNCAMPIHELRKSIPKQYPIRLYPDITHNVRCEYPVHFDRDDWHYALASTLSRESVNPRPTEYRTIHKLNRQYVCGSVSYSEGVHDDVNKAIWSALDFDPDVSITEALEDYSRLFFPGADTEKAVNGILGLETNWNGDPAENPHIENTLQFFSSMANENHELLENWRFLLLFFRAKCDMLVKSRRIFELKLIKKAIDALKNGNLCDGEEILMTQFPENYNKLHNEIFSMGDKLFNLIGIQLDTEHYCALSWERGATLDTIDNPVTDKMWLLEKIRYAKELPQNECYSFIYRLLNRNKTQKDEFYFSFADNSFTELGVKQTDGFYIDFQGDRPNVNNGSIPMSMLKVYDHYSFHCKTGGLISESGYNLILNIKPRYNDNVNNFTIKINGNILYSGKQYGGERNEKFDRELSAPGFETHIYKIPKNYIINGCAELEITEPLIGIMICEFSFKKANLN